MFLFRLTSSWNYSNPIELLLMRQAHAAIQLPSTNYRYFTGEVDSHLVKWKWKNNWADQGILLEILTEFITYIHLVCRLTFLLFVVCFLLFKEFWEADVDLWFGNPFIILSCFVILPFKVLAAKFLSQTVLILSIWQTACWLFFFLATHFNRTETSKDALGLLFCSVSRNMYNLRNIKYSLLCSLLCRTRKRNGSCTEGLRKFRCTE